MDSGALIREQLERLLASPELSNSTRLQEFLRFVVEAALRADSVKEAVIAAEVYGRTSDYDPAIDSAVRVDASRLRKKLKEYYSRTGAADRIRIEIPKGSYSPIFHGIDEVVASDAEPQPSRRWFWAAAGAVCAGAAALLRFSSFGTRRAAARVETAGALAPDELAAYREALLGAGFVFDKVPEAEPYLRVVAAPAGSARYIAFTHENGYPDSPVAGRTLHFESAEAARVALARGADGILEEALRVQGELLREPAARRRAREICRVAWKSHARNKDWFLSRSEERLRLSDLMQRAAVLERAIGVDPTLARAHAELSWIYHLAAEHDPAMLANSRRAAAEAMRLDPHFPPARYVQGYIRFFDDWKFAEAYQLWLAGCRSNPLYESWYRYMSEAGGIAGAIAEARAELARGRALLPRSAVVAAAHANLELHAGNTGHGVTLSEQLVQADPSLANARLIHAKALGLAGRFTEALTALDSAERLGANRRPLLATRAIILARAAQAQPARQAVEDPALGRMFSVKGIVYALLGDNARAAEALEQAFAARDANLPFALTAAEPAVQSLPGARELCSRLGIVSASIA